MWDYRLVREGPFDDGQYTYSIREVFYDSDNVVYAISPLPSVAAAEVYNTEAGKAEVKKTLNRMASALNKPVLYLEDFE